MQEDKKGNHLIPLNTALTLCEEMEKRNEVVNFITAVPKDQLSIWKKEKEEEKKKNNHLGCQSRIILKLHVRLKRQQEIFKQ